MSFNRTSILCVVNWSGNPEKYVYLSEDFLILSLEIHFGDCDVIFMEDNALRNRSRIGKKYLSQNNLPQMEWTACTQYINTANNI